MNTPTSMGTGVQILLRSITSDIIQPYFPATIRNMAPLKSSYRIFISKLTTNNFSIIMVPTIVTDCSPFSFVKYFHPTNAGRALRSFQPECCGCKKMQLLLKFGGEGGPINCSHCATMFLDAEKTKKNPKKWRIISKLHSIIKIPNFLVGFATVGVIANHGLFRYVNCRPESREMR